MGLLRYEEEKSRTGIKLSSPPNSISTTRLIRLCATVPFVNSDMNY